MKDEIVDMAKLVLNGRPRSYVEAAREFAKAIVWREADLEHWKARALVAEASLRRLEPAASREP